MNKIDEDIDFLEENVSNDNSQQIINSVVLRILKQLLKMIYRAENPNF